MAADLTQPIADYLKAVEHEFQTGIAAEHAYRPALEALLEAAGNGLNAVNDPRRSEIGAPDFVVLRGDLPIGVVEAKDIGIDLTRVERGEQMGRYLKFGNVILTDYLEFRWYEHGECHMTARIAEVRGKKIHPLRDQFAALASLLREFTQASVPAIRSARELAERMADFAHEIRLLIQADLQSDAPSPELAHQKAAFEQTLIPSLTPEQFADMLAQTLAYGLFAARVNYQGGQDFNRYVAPRFIPSTNPFLRRLFQEAGFDPGERVAWVVDRLAEVLNRTDMDAVLEGFGRPTQQEDPVIHFYETFLSHYDPAMRERRGVYYTPEPVVSYIVRSVDHLLKTRFNRPEGLADRNTLILDPATGTGTFLYFVIQEIYNTVNVRNPGAWDKYVRDNLLDRIFGFELLMAPYTIAHMKLGLELADKGYNLGQQGKRLGIYLTNTLEEQIKPGHTELIAHYIVEEAKEAAEVKRQKPIMVVLGNPPYSNFGQMNQGEWITEKMADWKPEGEKKWNPDDFMKFMRFAQWRIDRTGSGILAFITSNTYLDGITHHQMRKSLMDSFSEVYILNLHGGVEEKQETNILDDENVFDIQQGVAIAIFVKSPAIPSDSVLNYEELWGSRQKKYDYLLSENVSKTTWRKIHAGQENPYFIPRNTLNEAEYENNRLLPEVFGYYNSAVQTKKDNLSIHFERGELATVLDAVKLQDIEWLREHYSLGPDGRDWTISSAKQDVVREDGVVQPIQYRVFDFRWTYYSGRTKGFHAYPRNELARHLQPSNVALASVRQIAGIPDLCEVFVSRHLMTDRSMYSTRGTPYLFPLYVYPDPNELISTSPWLPGKHNRRPNLNPDFVREMEGKLGLRFVSDGQGDLQATFGPEDVFHYIYAVFHSPAYRERYAEFLKRNFPRVPLTSNVALFRALCDHGAALVGLHLLERVPAPTVRYPIKGNDAIESGYPKYTEPTADTPGRVYVNKTQYFEGVAPEIWEFHVGGYQVCDKWLKDRRGRALSYEDVTHYERIVAALGETIRRMEAIDALIDDHGGWPLQ